MQRDDRRWMRRALALARLSEGYTRPNPPVGAVVVKDGKKIGEGRHMKAGEAHAEVNAFDSCRVSAEGATLYVTLEPCCTTGRTPPCTDRIIREKVRRVVVGCVDENALHCGRGLGILREHGIEVEQGVCESEARELVIPFFKHIRTGLPYVTLKLAMTLDGRIADRDGTSKWITGEASRAVVQAMRRRADAVMVGAGTVCADNPSLLCRTGGGENLLRVIVDARGRIPADAQVLTDAAASRTIVATASAGHAAWTAHGATVWSFPADAHGGVPLDALMRRLGDEGLMHVLCEGGGQLAGSLYDAGLVDEYALFYAPVLLGDAKALSAFNGSGTLLPQAARLSLIETRRLGDDLLMRLTARKS